MSSPTKAPVEPTTHDEAEQIALAYIDKAFNNPEKPHRRLRHSIPANPREDTDLRLMAYIKQQRATVAAFEQEALDLRALERVVRRLVKAGEFDEAEERLIVAILGSVDATRRDYPLPTSLPETAGEKEDSNGKACRCYDDGVMCVTPPDCPTHGPRRAGKVAP